MQRSEAVATHQAGDPMLAARLSGLSKVEEDSTLDTRHR
jgi:hypothetical protein